MKNHIHPDIRTEDIPRIDAVISQHLGQPGSVIPVLRQCQEIVGYLPDALIAYIADRMTLPRSQVFGVATFYALFSRTPKGRHTVRVCMGTACYVNGGNDIMEQLTSRLETDAHHMSRDRKFSVVPVRCLGACSLAPVMMVDHHTHGHVQPDHAAELLKNYD